MKKTYKITIHCPYCGKEEIVSIGNLEKEDFKQEIHCECGHKFKIDYDKVIGLLKIAACVNMEEEENE